MRKLFTHIMLWLTALANSLNFSVAEETPFQSNDAYYSGKNHNEIDYRELYQSYVSDENTTDGCNITRRTTVNGLSNVYKGTAGPYWVVYEDSESSGETKSQDKTTTGNYKLGASLKNQIIAPSNCTILTDAGRSNFGTYMQISIGTGDIVITFDKLERWYCCLDRPNSAKTSAGNFTHTKNAKGKQLNAGDILGLATENTTMTITENGKVISLDAFFNGGA